MLRRFTFAPLFALILVCAVTASAQAPSQSTVFRRLLLLDANTSPKIKQLIRNDGGFVLPVGFSDITGDKKADAVVMVATGGAAGNVALYVFTADGVKGKKGTGTLRAVSRFEFLYRASAKVTGANVIFKNPKYAANDDLCCPTKTIQRTLRWNKASGLFRVTSTKEV